MSTPINQLPNNPQPTPDHSDDSLVSDVISEMEKEYISNKPQQPIIPPPNIPSLPQIYHESPPQIFGNSSYMDDNKTELFNEKNIKRSLIIALLGFVLFYPFELGLIYQKVPFLEKMAPYERFVKACLFAVLIYVLLTILNI